MHPIQVRRDSMQNYKKLWKKITPQDRIINARIAIQPLSGAMKRFNEETKIEKGGLYKITCANNNMRINKFFKHDMK